MHEHLQQLTQTELFASSQQDHQPVTLSPEALLDQLEQRYTQLSEQWQDGMPIPKEQHVLSSILFEIYTYSRWRLSPLAGLIYQREEFRQSSQALTPGDEVARLDALFVRSIDAYTTSQEERDYFEAKQRQRKDR